MSGDPGAGFRFPPYRLLDSWRGIAALAVVVYHAVPRAYDPEVVPTILLAAYRAGRWGWLGVTIFFVISGFCIANSVVGCWRKDNPVSSFVGSRFRRIYPPYLFASLSCILLSQVAVLAVRSGYLGSDSRLASLDFFDHGFFYYFSAVTLTQELFEQPYLNEVFWSLSYEAAFYGVVALLLTGTKWIGRPRLCIAGLNLTTTICCLWLIVAPRTCVYPFDKWPVFGLGVGLWTALSGYSTRWRWWVFSFNGMLYLVAALREASTFSLEDDQFEREVQGYVALSFTVVLLVLHRWDQVLLRQKLIRFLAGIGGFSYSLYLMHSLFIGIFSQIRKRIELQGAADIVFFATEIAVAVLLAWVFYRFFEAPFIRSRREAEKTNLAPLTCGAR